MNSDNDLTLLEHLAHAKTAIEDELRKRIVGQTDVIELLLITLLARGHGLFVGVPGLAKTRLVTTLAEALALESNRIQFTPDLMPSDVTGADVLEEDGTTRERRFRFVRGPVFTNLLLADEINRTPPKTQAALLQAMAESRVTVGGRTYAIGSPFVVFATQNPIEQEGTYALPEAQLDRFLLRIHVTYPSYDDELAIVTQTTQPETETVRPVLDAATLLAFQDLVPRVPAAKHIVEEAVRIVRATRPEDDSCPKELRAWVRFGAGPRASQGLVACAKARAALDGRYAVEIEDVHAVAHAVLEHRIVRHYRADADGVSTHDIVRMALARSPR